MSKIQNYQKYRACLEQILNNIRKNQPFTALFHGNCEHLIDYGLKQIKTQFSHLQIAPHIMEAKNISPQELATQLHSPPLFSEDHAFMIKRLECVKKGDSFLQKLQLNSQATSTIIFTHYSAKPATKIVKALESCEPVLVPCSDLSQNEAGLYLRDLAMQASLNLDSTAIRLLLETVGRESQILENEMNRLALIFAKENSSQQPLTSQKISRHLGLLKQEHAFSMESYLLNNQHAKAAAFMCQLIDRGLSPLALLGIVTNFYRRLMKLSSTENTSLNDKEIAKVTQIPSWRIGNYRSFLRSSNKTALAQGICFCQEADLQLKSSRTMPHLILWQAIAFLEKPASQSRKYHKP